MITVITLNTINLHKKIALPDSAQNLANVAIVYRSINSIRQFVYISQKMMIWGTSRGMSHPTPPRPLDTREHDCTRKVNSCILKVMT